MTRAKSGVGGGENKIEENFAYCKRWKFPQWPYYQTGTHLMQTRKKKKGKRGMWGTGDGHCGLDKPEIRKNARLTEGPNTS